MSPYYRAADGKVYMRVLLRGGWRDGDVMHVSSPDLDSLAAVGNAITDYYNKTSDVELVPSEGWGRVYFIC